MLTPLSWTVSETVTVPGRKRERKGRQDGARVSRTESEKGLAADVQPLDHRETHGHDHHRRQPSPPLHPPSQLCGHLLARMAPAALFQHRFSWE